MIVVVAHLLYLGQGGAQAHQSRYQPTFVHIQDKKQVSSISG